MGEKYKWVRAHLGQYFIERMILARDKTLIHGDILIDDRPQIQGKSEPAWKHVYHDRPYNWVENGGSPGTPRLDWKNWREVLGSELSF